MVENQMWILSYYDSFCYLPLQGGSECLGMIVWLLHQFFLFNLWNRKVGSKGEVGKGKKKGSEILHYVKIQETLTHLAEAEGTGWKLQPSYIVSNVLDMFQHTIQHVMWTFNATTVDRAFKIQSMTPIYHIWSDTLPDILPNMSWTSYFIYEL